MPMEVKKTRVFWGISLEADIRDQLVEATESIKKSFKHAVIKWLVPENLHLTLRFIGEATPELITQCYEQVKSGLTNEKTFEIKLNDIQMFPHNRPHVIACMVSLNDALARLYHLLEESCQACGLSPENRPYVPHITLARIKTYGHVHSDELPKNISMVQRVSEIILYKSEQHEGASHYTPLFTITLC